MVHSTQCGILFSIYWVPAYREGKMIIRLANPRSKVSCPISSVLQGAAMQIILAKSSRK